MADESYLPECASSAASCQTGVKVAGPQGECLMAAASRGNTIVCIDYNGDYVYVKDNKADNWAGMGVVHSNEGSVDVRYCRNNHGNGTWARCDFNWAESGIHYVEGGFKVRSEYVVVMWLWSWEDK
jgi:hypothetical protein